MPPTPRQIVQVQRRYGDERAVEALTGFSRRRLQKDRLFRRGFPFYKVGRSVLYDLAEIERIIARGRVGADS
jgi:hypothetical protein